MKKNLKENMREFIKNQKNPECYIIITNEGCAVNAKGDDFLAMISMFTSTNKNKIPKEAFKKAIDIGYDVDVEKDKADKKLDKELEKLEKIVKLIEELDNE